MLSETILTAFHEAGHAFAAVEMGLGACIKQVRIEGRGVRARYGMMEYFHRRHRPARFDFSRPEWANLELVVCMAGPMAEAFRRSGIENVELNSDWDQDSADFHGMRNYAEIVGSAIDKGRDDVLLEAAHFTHELLRDGWATVEAIAAALLEGDLTGFEVADICSRNSYQPGSKA
jgi:ATP-dependent Zn protease